MIVRKSPNYAAKGRKGLETIHPEPCPPPVNRLNVNLQVMLALG
jgi:hypothetical protein